MATREKRSEGVVGLFLLIGLSVLGALVVQFGAFGDRWKDKYPVHVEFQDAAGLIKGSEVRMGGAKIGRVAATPELTDDLTVSVTLHIDDRIKIYRGSKFQIESVTLLGDKMIVVKPPKVKSTDLIVSGEKIKGHGASGLDALQQDAKVAVADAGELIGEVGEAVERIQVATNNLNELLERINDGVLGDENLSALNTSLKNLKETSESFREGGKELQPAMAEIRSAVAKVSEAAEAASGTFDEATSQIEKLEPALEKVPETLVSISETAHKAGVMMDRAGKMMDNIEEGGGLIGTLAYDKEVTGDAKIFLKNLKRHGLLGYKDESTEDERDPKEDRFRGKRR